MRKEHFCDNPRCRYHDAPAAAASEGPRQVERFSFKDITGHLIHLCSDCAGGSPSDSSPSSTTRH